MPTAEDQTSTYVPLPSSSSRSNNASQSTSTAATAAGSLAYSPFIARNGFKGKSSRADHHEMERETRPLMMMSPSSTADESFITANGVTANAIALQQVTSPSSAAEFPYAPGQDDSRHLLTNGFGNKELLELQEEEAKIPPKDRYYGVFIVFLIHGIGVLMPWNVFITANQYFVDYKLGRDTEYGKNFLSYLGIASQIPNLLMHLLNVLCHFGGSLSKRIVVSIVIVIAITIATIVLAMLDSSEWPKQFFIITLASVVIMNGATGIYQNSIYGLVAHLPMKYANAIILGNNVCGTLIALMSLVSLVAAPDIKTATVYYFIASLVVLLVCFDSYFVLPQCKFYQHYKRLARLHHQVDSPHKCNSETPKTRFGQASLRKSRCGCLKRFSQAARPYVDVFKQAWVQFWNIFFLFFVTLTIFPAIQADTEASDPEFWIPHKYFATVTCYLLFNFFAMLGSILPHWICFPGPRFLWIPVLLRGLMIPYFVMCNYRPLHRTFPVYIASEYAYVFMGVLMAFSSGYFSSLGMMYAPKVVDPKRAGIAGMMAAFFLILGIVLGIQFTLFVAYVNENLGPLVPLIQQQNLTLSTVATVAVPSPSSF